MTNGHQSFTVRAIYALCLLGATYNHAAIVAEHGLFWDYGGLPAVSATFWTALTVLDPAAAALLFLRPNFGVVMTAIIIVVDVANNVWIVARYFPPLLHGLAGSPQVVEQIAFMVFVLATVAFAWVPEGSGRRGLKIGGG